MMFNSYVQIKKEGALSLGLYTLSGFLLAAYFVAFAALLVHFFDAVISGLSLAFLKIILSSTLFVLSSLLLSLPLAFSLFYLWFQKDPVYVRFRIHDFISFFSELPILIFGLFFLVVFPEPYLSLFLLFVFMTLPRFYFILNEQLSYVDPMAIEAGQSLGLSVWRQVWLLFFVRNFNFYFLQIFIVGIRTLGILAPLLALLSYYEDQGLHWFSFAIFEALVLKNVQVAQWVMWFLILYFIAFLLESRMSGRQRFENG